MIRYCPMLCYVHTVRKLYKKQQQKKNTTKMNGTFSIDKVVCHLISFLTDQLDKFDTRSCWRRLRKLFTIQFIGRVPNHKIMPKIVQTLLDQSTLSIVRYWLQSHQQ